MKSDLETMECVRVRYKPTGIVSHILDAVTAFNNRQGEQHEAATDIAMSEDNLNYLRDFVISCGGSWTLRDEGKEGVHVTSNVFGDWRLRLRSLPNYFVGFEVSSADESIVFV